MPEPTDSSPRQPQEAQPLHVTWLHISDLHFRASQTYDAGVVLDALLRDVAERVQQDGLRPDFIAVTGDIAFAGQAAEYALARRFFDDLLKATGLPGKRLFVVPGNHDVNRKLISAGAKAIGDALTDRDKANELLSTPGDRRLLFAHFQGYAEFVNDYLDHLAFDDEHYFYVHTLDLAGQQVALLGLNSAWLCAGDEDKAKGLVLGERQVRTALKQAQGASLKIALLHHPFDRLREFDQGDSAAMLLDGCDFVLHGHLHQTAATQLISPDGAATVLACGACYETRQFPNMVNWVRLDLAAGDGAVHLRRYSDERGGFWAKDTLSYRNAPDGVYSFLRVPARAPQGPPVGGEPGQPPETGAAPLAAERDACVDVQALHPPRQTPPDGSPITERDDDATPSGDSSRARLEQRRREHQTRWDDLSGRIQALQKDLGQEMDGERRQTLESRLADRRAERDQVEAALHKIERRLE